MTNNRRNLNSDIWRESVSEEVSAELSFHVEMRARELAERDGISIEDARRIAVSRFGDMRDVQSKCEDIGGKRNRDMKRTTYLSELGQDIRYALRQIRSAPAFALLVIATLGLGIAVTTTIFSAVNAVVLQPLPFRNADRVLFISETYKGSDGDVSPGTYTDWATQSTQLDAIGAIDWGNYIISTSDAPDRVLGAAVTHDYFKVFDAKAALGRLFSAEDDAPGAPRVVVLSYDTYATRFGANPGVIGKDVIVNGEPARVIGVLPAKFNPMFYNEQVYTPLPLTGEQIAARGSHWLNVVGRVKPDATVANAESQLKQIEDRAGERFPTDYANRGVHAIPIREFTIGDFTSILFLLFGAVFAVLLIACSNVANLLLARGAARAKEMAVRGALGAGRGRLLRQLLTENLVLSLVSVVVAVAASSFGIRAIAHAAAGDVPRIDEMRVDGKVFLFAMLLGVACSLFFGLAPALRATRQDLQSTLRGGGRDTQGSVKDLLRSALVATEVALSVLLLTCAGLLIRTSIQTAKVDAGFRVDGVITAHVSLPSQSYSESDHALAAFNSIVDRLKASPGITHAAVSSLPPLSPGGNEMFLNAGGKANTQENAVVGRVRIISDDYFNALNIPIQRGRGFNPRDVRSAELVAVINAQLAQKMWPGEDPIGKRFACCEGSESEPVYKTVVGVIPDFHSRGPTLPADAEFYIPLLQAPPDSWNWIGRTLTVVATGRDDAHAIAAQITGAVHATDPNIPVYGISSVARDLERSTASQRFNATLLTMLGSLGLILAAIGIYGVVSYFVNLKTKEIGVRIALGATTGSVLGLMIRQAMVPVAIGLGVGVAAALAATRVLASSLFGITPTDPVTFVTVIATLALVSLVAIIVPARRASRVPPTEALIG